MPSLSGIGSDVVLAPGNFQAYPDIVVLIFSTQAPGPLYTRGVNIKNPLETSEPFRL